MTMRLIAVMALSLFVAGCDLFVPQDPKIRWRQADVLTIQMSAAEDAWHAGRVNDILKLEPENGMLVASEAGGVWEISRNAQAHPVSDGWASSSMSTLARGPDGSRHVYAGTWPNGPSEGGVLMETDTSSSLPMHVWRRVDPKPPCGSIARILVINETRRIVLACDTGLYWSRIPPAPSAQGAYAWIDATPGTVQGGRTFAGLAKGPGWANGNEGTIVAARWGGTAPRDAIYSGGWSGGKLVFEASNVDQGPGNFLLDLDRTSLAACPGDPMRMFAVGATTNGRDMAGMWRSTDRGQKWTMIPMPLKPGGQGNHNNAIAVSSDCNTLAVGWQGGTWVSYAGGEWNLLSGGSHLHSDVGALAFDPADPATLYIGSDGGVASASRLGPGSTPVFASNWNRQLFNLQIYHAAGSTAASGLVAAGLQDNGVVYAGLPGPWKHVTACGCDGRWSAFLAPPDIGKGKSILMEEEWGQPDFPFCSVQANGTTIPLDAQQGILVSPPSKEVLTNVLTVVVPSPGGYSNAAGQMLFGFGGFGTSLYGLFANEDGSNLHWEQFSGIGGGQNITALAPTYDGQSVFVGTDKGNILRLTAPFTGWLQMSQNLPLIWAGRPRSISGIVSTSSTTGFATVNTDGHGYVLSLDSNWVWNAVGRQLAHDRPFNSIAASDRGTIFVSTSAAVYDTYDRGITWVQASAGLPADITASNELKFVSESGGANYLYLSTYGRSLWRAQLP